MHLIDWIIVGIYAAILVAIGVISNQKLSKKTKKAPETDDSFEGFMRAAKDLPWWALGLSLIATSFSAASILGGPGEGYSHGFLYLQLQLGDLIGYSLVILVLLPFFVKLDIISAYEYLEKRFDNKNRALGSLFFLLFVIARLGGLLYAASLVFATVSGMPLSLAIILVGIVSIIYTVTGGMAAVVWTDVLQFVMIFLGLIAGIWSVITLAPEGVGTLWTIAAAGGKVSLINWSWEPQSIRSLPTAAIAYGILSFAVAGTNQQSVQRYVSNKNITSARKAIILSWFAGFLGVAVTLLLGVLLYGFYSLNGGLPQEIQPDGILSYFIVNQVPIGASGLLVAAIFAAAMSSIDSALHSLATSMTIDFYIRYSTPKPSGRQSVRFAQMLIVVWGIISILSAFYVASTGESLLPFLIKYTSMFLGPLLGLFLLGVLFPQVNATGAFYGTMSAVLILILAPNLGWFSLPGIWQSAVSAPLTILFGWLISKIVGHKRSDEALKGLTLWTMQADQKENQGSNPLL